VCGIASVVALGALGTGLAFVLMTTLVGRVGGRFSIERLTELKTIVVHLG
jgi:hypothetical protein